MDTDSPSGKRYSVEVPKTEWFHLPSGSSVVLDPFSSADFAWRGFDTQQGAGTSGLESKGDTGGGSTREVDHAEDGSLDNSILTHRSKEEREQSVFEKNGKEYSSEKKASMTASEDYLPSEEGVVTAEIISYTCYPGAMSELRGIEGRGESPSSISEGVERAVYERREIYGDLTTTHYTKTQYTGGSGKGCQTEPMKEGKTSESPICQHYAPTEYAPCFAPPAPRVASYAPPQDAPVSYALGQSVDPAQDSFPGAGNDGVMYTPATQSVASQYNPYAPTYAQPCSPSTKAAALPVQYYSTGRPQVQRASEGQYVSRVPQGRDSKNGTQPNNDITSGEQYASHTRNLLATNNSATPQQIVSTLISDCTEGCGLKETFSESFADSYKPTAKKPSEVRFTNRSSDSTASFTRPSERYQESPQAGQYKYRDTTYNANQKGNYTQKSDYNRSANYSETTNYTQSADYNQSANHTQSADHNQSVDHTQIPNYNPKATQSANYTHDPYQPSSDFYPPSAYYHPGPTYSNSGSYHIVSPQNDTRRAKEPTNGRKYSETLGESQNLISKKKLSQDNVPYNSSQEYSLPYNSSLEYNYAETEDGPCEICVRRLSGEEACWGLSEWLEKREYLKENVMKTKSFMKDSDWNSDSFVEAIRSANSAVEGLITRFNNYIDTRVISPYGSVYGEGKKPFGLVDQESLPPTSPTGSWLMDYINTHLDRSQNSEQSTFSRLKGGDIGFPPRPIDFVCCNEYTATPRDHTDFEPFGSDPCLDLAEVLGVVWNNEAYRGKAQANRLKAKNWYKDIRQKAAKVTPFAKKKSNSLQKPLDIIRESLDIDSSQSSSSSRSAVSSVPSTAREHPQKGEHNITQQNRQFIQRIESKTSHTPPALDQADAYKPQKDPMASSSDDEEFAPSDVPREIDPQLS